MDPHPQPSNACLKAHEDTYYMQVHVDEASATENENQPKRVERPST